MAKKRTRNSVPVKKQERMSFDSQLLSMTTLIICKCGKDTIQGSGFFYNIMSPHDPSVKGGQWRRVESSWLITNRHVALPEIDGKETIPDEIIFHLREHKGRIIEWIPIILTKEQIVEKMKLHQNSVVDVVSIKIDEIVRDVTNKYTNDQLPKLISHMGLTNDHMPTVSKIKMEVASDVIMAGYPEGFYDKINKFPIVKSGVIASAWGQYFLGEPRFLIDCSSFNGSSGSLILSKPVDLALIEGKLSASVIGKQFVFLGVYSGDYIEYGLGNVWYSHLIPEIIENGVNISKNISH